MAARLTACTAALVLLACTKAPDERGADTATGATNASQASRSFAKSIVEREWALVTLGDSAAPLGSGGKRATIRFDSAAARAGGFAG